ncbi:MAG: DUF58 domain-containing protein [Roseiflexaceae bacterium]
MWFRTTSRPEVPPTEGRLFDELFLRRLERLTLQPQQTLRGVPTLGEHLSRQQLPTTIFSDHRPYTSGDDYRLIDWNVYARQGDIVVKLGEIEQRVQIHLLVDVSRSMAWGQPTKLRVALQLVAALGYLGLSHHDQITVQPFGDDRMRPFGPATGKSRLVELLRYLEGQRADRQTALASVLANHAAQHPRGGLAVICSDLLTPEGLSEGLRHLAPPRWQTLVLHVIDPRELNPPTGESIELLDAETGERLPVTLNQSTLTIFQQNVAAWQAQIRNACARQGAIYAPISTIWPFERQIIPYLHMRRILS